VVFSGFQLFGVIPGFVGAWPRGQLDWNVLEYNSKILKEITGIHVCIKGRVVRIVVSARRGAAIRCSGGGRVKLVSKPNELCLKKAQSNIL
jgi:hypothetical protein